LATIGGDHSVSFPLIAAFENLGPLTIVLFDAHLDYRDTFLGLEFTNNSPFRRANELPFVKRIVTLGVRGIKSTDQEYRESVRRGNIVISADTIAGREVGAIIDEIGDLGNYYLSSISTLSIHRSRRAPRARKPTVLHFVRRRPCCAGSHRRETWWELTSSRSTHTLTIPN
jgi:hypothetical protein